MWKKEKLLVMSNLSFSHSVFKRLVLQTCVNKGLSGKRVNVQNLISLLFQEIEGYVKSQLQSAITYFFIFITLGFLRLVFHWLPHRYLKCTHRRASLGEATSVLLRVCIVLLLISSLLWYESYAQFSTMSCTQNFQQKFICFLRQPKQSINAHMLCSCSVCVVC